MNVWKRVSVRHTPKLPTIAVCPRALFLCVAINLFLPTLLPAQIKIPENQDTYTIHGTVVNSVTRAAIGHALVYSADRQFAKLTDDQGHFEFKVPRPPSEQGTAQHLVQTFPDRGSGQLRRLTSTIVLMARKPGYFDSQKGPQPIGIDSDTSSEITISLVPEGLITGHVNLPANDGTDKIQVEVYRRQVQEGRGHWVPAGSVSTRTNGEFRFANLSEGEYKLFTRELQDRDPLTFDPRGPLFGYPPAYYPFAADFESAAVIHLKAGQVFSATLTPTRREYYPVKLPVQNAALGAGFAIAVEPRGHPGPGYSLGYNPDESAIEGSLPNGSYRLEVTKYGEEGASGTLNVSVNGAAVQGPNLVLAPNRAIEVHPKDERTSTQNPPDMPARNFLAGMNLRLVPSDEFRFANPLWLRPPKNPEDESLAFGSAQPATYRVQAGCHPSAYVAAITSGGRDLLRQPLVVGLGAAIPPIEITIRDDGAQVNGSIENWLPQGRGQPSGNVPVVFLLPFPDSPGQFCEAWANPTGEFSFPQIPPGEYRVIAFDRLPENLEYGNAEVMQKYESKAQVLRLVPGQKENLRLMLNTESQ